MLNDYQLHQAVLTELEWEPSVNAAHIGVTANNGVVTLSGHVSRYSEKQAAEKAAARVRGVKAVAEEIEVKFLSELQRSDEDIAAAAISRLSWNAAVPTDVVKIKVEKGWVTLTGTVTEHFQKISAEMDIRSLHGVRGVSNEIAIKSTVSVNDVSDDIRSALSRLWFFSPKTVNVTAIGGNIKLSGTVHSLHDRKLAGSIAWAAPGAVSVENDLAVVF
jgi:osmotically-inducible protein OsmY